MRGSLCHKRHAGRLSQFEIIIAHVGRPDLASSAPIMTEHNTAVALLYWCLHNPDLTVVCVQYNLRVVAARPGPQQLRHACVCARLCLCVSWREPTVHSVSDHHQQHGGSDVTWRHQPVSRGEHNPRWNRFVQLCSLLEGLCKGAGRQLHVFMLYTI